MMMSLTVSLLGLALTLSSILPSVAVGAEAELIGHWDGSMVRDGVPLEVSFDFKGPASQPKGSFTSLTQKAMDYPLDGLTVSADAVHFVLGGSIVFDGKLSPNQIIGTFTDDSGKGDFTLHRAVATTLPYDTADVSFSQRYPSPSGTSPGIPRLRASMRRWSFYRAAVPKPAGVPIALLLIGSLAQGLLHWSTTSEDREPPPGTGKCPRMTIWRMTQSPESIFLLRDLTSMQNGLDCMGYSEAGGTTAPIAAVCLFEGRIHRRRRHCRWFREVIRMCIG